MPAKTKTKTTKTKTTSKQVKKTSSKTSLHPTTPSPRRFSRKLLIILLILIGLALLFYRLLPWLVPVVVNKRPITRWQVYQQMNKAYGQQTLNDLVNEALLKEGIEHANISVDEARVEEELNKLRQQFEQVGGLDQALAQRGLTLDDLRDQIETQLAIEEILKDKITPSEEEVRQEFEKNKDTLYKDKQFEEVKDNIAKSLKQVKLSQAFLDWFNQLKQEIKIKYLSPTPLPSPTPQN